MTAFDRAWDVVKAPWYYHATPEENVMPILSEGIKTQHGEVYASKDPELARNWISMTKPQASKVGVIPFWRDEGDPRIQPGTDHSPLMIEQLMGPDYEGYEGGSVVSNEPIPNTDLLPQMEARGTPSNEDRSAGNPGIGIWDNPMYDPNFSEKWKALEELMRRRNSGEGDGE
tara:strand:+ start:1132 stop:1647 length:516 start_codon:yes stop_codon:yes gene_type:complete